jgi:hypothetical protein
MSPGFLQGVAVPQVYQTFMDIVSLWKEKTRLSKGRSFSVKEDLYDGSLEAIWAVLFGSENTATITRNQISQLTSMKAVALSSSAEDDAAELPKAEAPPVFEAILRLTDSLEYVGKSPFPRITGFIICYIPYFRRLIKVKDRVIKENIAKAEERMAKKGFKSDGTLSGVEHMLRREQMAAEKQKRSPDFNSKIMIAEVCLLSESSFSNKIQSMLML